MITEKSTIDLTAVYNDKKTMRYSLKRTWDETKPSAVIICSNAPQTSDITRGDLTSLLIQNNLTTLGYGSVICVNLFCVMCQKLDLSGNVEELTDDENTQHILHWVQNTDVTIVAIGSLSRTYRKVAVHERRLFESLSQYQSKLRTIAAPDGTEGHHPLSAKLREVGSWELVPFKLPNLPPSTSKDEKDILLVKGKKSK